MPVAQVIRLDERQAIPRPPRRAEQARGVLLRFPMPTGAGAERALMLRADDEDRIAGRGRDPG